MTLWKIKNPVSLSISIRRLADGSFVGEFPALPHITTRGETYDEAIRNTSKAIVAYLDGKGVGVRPMIEIEKSATADTRSCDFSKVTVGQLYQSSIQHIGDVRKALAFFTKQIEAAALRHDYDKLSEIEWFHADFVTGFVEHGWWDNHRKLNRHHLLEADGVPEDVNLIDVLDMVADCVMAGMGRTGEVYPLNIPPEVLMNAFQNTVTLLKRQVVVKGVQHEPDSQRSASA
jgi:predicted RNase H-like HicB family nuclease